MKALKTLLRLRQWELDERRKSLAMVEEKREEIVARQESHERAIVDEQAVANATGDPMIMMSYAGYHTRAIKMRQDMAAEQEQLKPHLDAARDRMAEAFKGVKQFEQLKEAADKREQAELDKRETEMLDELGLNTHRRKDPEA